MLSEPAGKWGSEIMLWCFDSATPLQIAKRPVRSPLGFLEGLHIVVMHEEVPIPLLGGHSPIFDQLMNALAREPENESDLGQIEPRFTGTRHSPKGAFMHGREPTRGL